MELDKTRELQVERKILDERQLTVITKDIKDSATAILHLPYNEEVGQAVIVHYSTPRKIVRDV